MSNEWSGSIYKLVSNPYLDVYTKGKIRDIISHHGGHNLCPMCLELIEGFISGDLFPMEQKINEIEIRVSRIERNMNDSTYIKEVAKDTAENVVNNYNRNIDTILKNINVALGNIDNFKDYRKQVFDLSRDIENKLEKFTEIVTKLAEYLQKKKSPNFRTENGTAETLTQELVKLTSQIKKINLRMDK